MVNETNQVSDEQRAKLHQLMISASETYDKNIFTLATIILSSSFAFIKYYPNFQEMCLLYISWFSFIIAIIVTLGSLLYVQKSAANYYEKNIKSTNYFPFVLQCTAGLFFVAALLLLMIFIICNIATH